MPGNSNSLNTRVGAMAPDASTSAVEWGPEIQVNGKRPEWLASGPQCILLHNVTGWHQYRADAVNPDHVGWAMPNGTANVDLIRLPADHPHYRQPTTSERDPALWDRMVALVRSMADRYDNGRSDDESVARDAYPWMREARAIVADLPKPVDPDLLLAREIVAEEYGDGSNVAHLAAQARSGEGDEWFHTKVVLRAIRKLRAPEVSHVG